MCLKTRLYLIALVCCAVFAPGCSDDGGSNQPTKEDDWSPLPHLNNLVNTMTIYDGELIVGGAFTNAGGVSANYVARWDGASWHPLGEGVRDETTGIGRVSDLAVFKGNLIVAGYFSKAGAVGAKNIAQWNGVSWAAMGSGIDSIGFIEGVYAMTVYDGDLVVGGDFRIAGEEEVNHIAVWDGSAWADLGGGVSLGGFPGTAVWSLDVVGNDLIVGGNFRNAGDVVVNNLAVWDGASWSPLGSGTAGGQLRSTVSTQVAYDADLVVGGEFMEAGGTAASHIAAWDGSSWSPLGSGTNGVIQCVTVYGGRLVAGGNFSSAGGVGANCVALWNGSSWEAMGNGLSGGLFGITLVADLVVLDGRLVAGGSFTAAGGESAGHIAVWED